MDEQAQCQDQIRNQGFDLITCDQIQVEDVKQSEGDNCCAEDFRACLEAIPEAEEVDGLLDLCADRYQECEAGV